MVSKAWKITIEDFRVILVLEFNNIRTKILYFGILKKKLLEALRSAYVTLNCARKDKTFFLNFSLIY